MKISEEDIYNANSLVEIKELVHKCERCSLYKTKTTDVVGGGSDKAEIMFIGEAPGKKEDEIGEPFVGTASKLLNEMLTSIDLKREDIYIANVLKHRPPNNRDPLPDETAACWPYLKCQIELINPKLIVFLGRHAMNRFFPELNIAEMHGQDFQRELWGRKQHFLALYHPSNARFASRKPIFKSDMSKIPAILAKIKNNIKK